MSIKKRFTAFFLVLVMMAVVMVPNRIVHAETPADYDALWEDAIKNVYATSSDGVDGGNVWRKDLGLAPWSGNLNGTPITSPTEKINDMIGNAVDAYVVQNADELRWAMVNADINAAKGIPGIKLAGDIDLAGYNDTNWDAVDINAAVIINGDNHTIWNMKIDSTKTDGVNDGFIGKVTHDKFYLRSLNISNAYCEFGTAASWNAGGSGTLIGNINGGTVSDCFVFNTGILGGYLSSGFIAGSRYIGNAITIKNCGTRNVRIYSVKPSTQGGVKYGCVSSFFEAGSNANISNSFSIDGTVIATAGHSGGFLSCTNQMTVKNCFTNVDVYGNTETGSFSGPTHNGDFVFENCYSSGKIEGTSDIGGFLAANINYSGYSLEIKNCYSTSMVGMSNGGSKMGSFAGSIGSNTKVASSYAAGETGSLDTNLNKPVSVGGFIGVSGKGTLADNYYDKQTTAMREWASGNSKNVSGVTGLLSTDSDKGGAGLASASAPVFSASSNWLCQDEQYPQLTVFANPDAAIWGTNTELVKAYSKASVQTVLLETYDKDYDEQVLGTDVYDTVRDITSKFRLSDGGAWTKGIKKGDGSFETETTIINGKEYDVLSMEVLNGKQWVTDFAPGIEWSRVESNENNNIGFRNLRLCPTINLDAGSGQSVIAGNTYDHRPDVSLAYTRATDLAQNNLLFEGSFNQATNSSTILNASLAGGLDAAAGASGNKFHVLIYDFEIGDVSPDASFSIDELKGKTQNPTEVTIAGELDKMYTGVNAILNTQKGYHFLEYIWTLPDGRYVRNGKMVTVKDVPFNININAVKDITQEASGANLDSESVMLGASGGTSADVSGTRTANAHVQVDYGNTAAVSWKVPEDGNGNAVLELTGATIRSGTDYTEWRTGNYNKEHSQFEAISYDYSIVKNTGTGNYDIVAKEIKRTYPITKTGNTYSVTFDFDDTHYKDIEDNLEINLQFGRIPAYTVKYDTQGAGPIADKTDVNYADAALLPQNAITKDGATFLGWKYGDIEVTDGSTYESLAQDDTLTSITLVAEWKENIYKVKYDTGFDDVTVEDKDNVKWNDSDLLPETPKKDGYGFIGWEIDGRQTAATDKYSDLTADQTDGSFIVLTAKWLQLRDYSVLYNTNGGSMPADVPSAITGMKYEDIVPTPTPARPGYVFTGWIYNNSAVAADSAYNTLAADDTVKQIELAAQWEEKDYTVKYDTQGADPIEDKTGVKFADSGLLPDEGPSRTGFTFTGWMLDDTQVTAQSMYSSLVTDDTIAHITLVAQWEINSYTINFEFVSDKNPDGISAPASVTAEYGATVDEPNLTVPSNWTFDGWYTDQICTQRYDFGTPIAENMTLYGKWSYKEPVDPKPGEPSKPSEPTKLQTPGAPDRRTDVPQTGDNSNLDSWIVSLGISAGLLLILAGKRRK